MPNRISTRWMALIAVLLFASACGGSGSGSGVAAFAITGEAIPLAPSLTIAGTESNVMPVTVGCGYINEPCVTVTVCTPGGTLGSSSCVAISNVLLDTGSSGLRIFSSALTSLSLSAQIDPVSKNPIAECQSNANGISTWGSVVTADVVLANGNERAANVPIQLINSSYAQTPSGCSNLASSPATNGYNGILGVGLFSQDCGTNCVTPPMTTGPYYECPSGAPCAPVAVALTQQVINPVNLLTTDNNGVILQFATVAASGVSSATGYAILGIGTETDNTPPPGVTIFTTNGIGQFQTMYNGNVVMNAYLDSGINANYIPDPTITSCPSSGSDKGYYCNTNPINFNSIAVGITSYPQDILPSQIVNASTLSSSKAASGLAGPSSGLIGPSQNGFVWGMPFFYGKTVYVGTNGFTSQLGPGPLWGI